MGFSLIALVLAAIPLVNWADMRTAAGRLRSADLAWVMTAPDVADYRKRLSAVREATGGSAGTIAALTVQVARELSKESERQVTCLSVLDAAASMAQTRAHKDERVPLVEQFETTRDRLRKMYRKQGGPSEDREPPSESALRET